MRITEVMIEKTWEGQVAFTFTHLLRTGVLKFELVSYSSLLY
jgi:hypothetical protein